MCPREFLFLKFNKKVKERIGEGKRKNIANKEKILANYSHCNKN
jgi:hypothetical protein